MLYRDRFEAGRVLAKLLQQYRGRPDAIVLALPRGGVPVGFEVAKELQLPLDVFIVRKIGMPRQRELAMGAIASGGALVLDPSMVRMAGLNEAELNAIIERERREIERREREYRGDRPPADVHGKTVILVDDGLATGSTMRAAALALRSRSPKKLVVAVPVGARSTCDELQGEADEVVCAARPEDFHAVGLWYEDFTQTTDGEVRELLERARKPDQATRVA
jgi:putative phosphoribosyl transferase